MIVRATLEGPVEPFDVFNDYRDTLCWLSSLSKSAERDIAIKWLTSKSDDWLAAKPEHNLRGTVSFVSRMWDCRARDLWQALFDFYRFSGGSLDHMDNLLIDLSYCVKAMDMVVNGGSIKFLWGAYLRHGCTYWVFEKDWVKADPIMTNSYRGSDIYAMVDLSKDQAIFEYRKTTNVVDCS